MIGYNPHKWLMVQIKGPDPHYRILGSWMGGYLDGDSWRLNSGVVRVEEENDYYHFYGSSGSCYTCRKANYGAHLFGYNVLDKYQKEAPDMIFPLSEEEALKVIESEEWIIS